MVSERGKSNVTGLQMTGEFQPIYKLSWNNGDATAAIYEQINIMVHAGTFHYNVLNVWANCIYPIFG